MFRKAIGSTDTYISLENTVYVIEQNWNNEPDKRQFNRSPLKTSS